MQKIELKLNVKKLDKTRFVHNSYKLQDGTEVGELNANITLVEKKEARVIKDTDTYTLKETHFAVEQQTKEERAAKKESNYVGVGLQFFNKEEPQKVDGTNIDYPQSDISPEDIPF